MVSQFCLPVAGGLERIVADMAAGLSARGHDVAVAASTPTPRLDPSVRTHRISTLVGRMESLHTDASRRHVPPFPDPDAVRSLRRIVAEEHPDVIHAHDWMVHSLPPFSRGVRPALVLSLHDYSLLCADKRMYRGDAVCPGPSLAACVACAGERYGRVKGLVTAVGLRPSTAVVRRRVDLMLPVSSAVARLSGLAPGTRPFDVVPNFVPDALVTRGAPRIDVDGLPPGPYIAYAGDATRYKGAQVLLDAYAGMRDAPALVLIGRTFPDENLRVPPGVVILGRRAHDEVLATLGGAVCSVVPSVWEEPFGIVAIEALALGIPVIASRIGGLADIVEDGVSGLMVPPGDAPALAAAMRRIVDDPALAARLADGARRRGSDYAASQVITRVEAAYARARDLARAT